MVCYNELFVSQLCYIQTVDFSANMESTIHANLHSNIYTKMNHCPPSEEKDKQSANLETGTESVQNPGHPPSPTETCSDATTLSTPFYGTPFTSLSGFDVYMTAFEDSQYSLDKVPSKKDAMIVDSKEKQDMNITVNPVLTNHIAASTSSPKGKGGERMGDSGKCTPKKSAFISPRKLPVSETKSSISSMSSTKTQKGSLKTPNGSIKTPNTSEDMSTFKKGLLGGTKALLIQKHLLPSETRIQTAAVPFTKDVVLDKKGQVT